MTNLDTRLTRLMQADRRYTYDAETDVINNTLGATDSPAAILKINN